jgi:hypothetical protein
MKRWSSSSHSSRKPATTNESEMKSIPIDMRTSGLNRICCGVNNVTPSRLLSNASSEAEGVERRTAYTDFLEAGIDYLVEDGDEGLQRERERLAIPSGVNVRTTTIAKKGEGGRTSMIKGLSVGT